jgi:hypothetical protein
MEKMLRENIFLAVFTSSPGNLKLRMEERF